MPDVTRRNFFGQTALAASQVPGANDRIRVGLIGSGGRGRYVTRFMTEAGAELVAACDVNRPVAEKTGATVYTDFRKLLEVKEIDAVVVATPDHWHATAAILAMQAGKHVYTEKPLAYSVYEGQAIVKAAAKTKQIVLPGTQQRSAPHYAEIADMVRSGLIGPVHMVRVWNFSNMLPNGIGLAPDGPPPDTLDWDFYCGPAPLRAYNPKRVGPTFRWFWDYATGMISDFGTHRHDTVHQIMNSEMPVAVSASGGRFELKDQGEMPDTMQVTYEYPGWVMAYEMSNINGFGMGGNRAAGMRYYNMRATDDRPHGEAYYGTKGTIIADRVGYEVYVDGQPPKRMNTTDATSLHAKHFLECIRGKEKPHTTALIAHRATNIAHIGNIAFKTGRKLKWDPEREVFPGDKEANEMLRRIPRAKWDLIG
jgi:predicted dehydrogenase